MADSARTVGNGKKGDLFSLPPLSLPSGGGAIKGIGETFQPDSFSGSGSISIPIDLSPCRTAEPKLTLDYSSGSGNGVFGVGFSLSLSKISRRTEKGVPRYDGSDVFVWSDEDVLVPKMRAGEDGTITREQRSVEQDGVVWNVTAYMPRVEGMFASIQYWESAGGSYWIVIDRENATSIYGRSDCARIADPLDGTRIFQWLLEQTVDAKGNKTMYTYKRENDDNVPREIAQQNRAYTANAYVERLQYGNYFTTDGQEKWAFEVIFDYGEYDLSAEVLQAPSCDPYTPAGKWQARLDPFSTFRSGFEIRTMRLCQNILLFQHFEKKPGDPPCLVKAVRLRYQTSLEISLLSSVEVTGYRRRDDHSYESKSMPPVSFTYSLFQPDAQPFQPLSIADEDGLPGDPNGSEYHLIDLYGEGIPGVLYSDGQTTFYWRALGQGEFASRTQLDPVPIERDLRREEYALASLEGNGQLELVVSSPQRAGYYAAHSDGTWDAFQRFLSFPTDYDTGSKEWVDMEGDGLADLLIFEDSAMKFYPSQGKAGYGAPVRTLVTEPDFPVGTNVHAEEVVTFADLFGDNLSHRVRIRNGSVECWPNRGYGLFGKAVSLANAPQFGDRLDPARLFLADLNGSGTTDIVYVYPDRAELFLNQSGNRFSDPVSIPLPELYTPLDRIAFADLLGTGTSCLIFTKMDSQVRHYYCDFAHNGKPYLLTGMDNSRGMTTSITYASSVQSYLRDQKAGTPWRTRLPFPVAVVEKVESIDWISGSKLATRYQYHDGYYDPVEKEFQGFGFVEQWDTESWEQSAGDGQKARLLTSLDADTFVQPAYVKRWYHTGAAVEAGMFTSHYRTDYYQQDKDGYLMPDSTLDPSIDAADAETIRQTYRALKGHLLREETYGQDQIAGVSEHPYTVIETSYQVRQIQARQDQPFAVFFVHERESLACHYERNPFDPRAEHEFVLEVDEYGFETKSCTVYYPRRTPGSAANPALPVFAVETEQTKLRAKALIDRYIHLTDDCWLLGHEAESRSFEIGGLELGEQLYFRYDQLRSQAEAALANVIRPEESFLPGQTQARTLAWERTYYWNQEQDAALPLGSITARALPHHREQAVFSPQFIADVFAGRVTDSLLETDGGYVQQDGFWWNRGLVQHFCKEADRRFFLPYMLENPFAANGSSLYAKTVVEYDPYALVPLRSVQYLTEQIMAQVTAVPDYAAMQYRQITDSNDNVSQVLFDPLGMVVATSLFGTVEGKNTGDGDLAHYQVRQAASFDDVLAHPEAYLQEASTFFYYDDSAWRDRGTPSCAINLYRDTHCSEQEKGQANRIHLAVTYLDGFGRVLETKTKVEPDAAAVSAEPGQDASERWLASGRTIYNNKGMAAKEYQPYFSATPMYEEQSEVEPRLPPPTITHYDPLLRVVQVDTPKGFFSKHEFTAWSQRDFDENDTVKDSVYYQTFMANVPADPSQEQADEKDALVKAARCYGTPSVKIFNNTGEPFLSVEDNLGEIASDAFADLVYGTATSSEQLWQELVRTGYLEPSAATSSAARVTGKFQPYQRGFFLDWDEAYRTWEEQVIGLFIQSCLTTYHALDLEGRILSAIDPRLYRANAQTQSGFYSFIYRYDLQGQPISVDSADAGLSLTLLNIFGNPVHEWNQRGFHTAIQYDSFQRPVELRVEGDDGNGLVLQQSVEKWVYGESYGSKPDDAKAKNLLGHLYQHYDQAGVVCNDLYGLQNTLLRTTRQLLADYKREANWDQTDQAKLDENSYLTTYTYDALGRVVSETTPDGSVSLLRYSLFGQLQALAVQTKEGTRQAFMTDAVYNASHQLLQITYGNGVVTRYGYEDSTSRLLRLQSSRPGTDGTGKQRSTVLQNLSYAYDPVGNVTRVRDLSQETVFCNQQMVEPLSDYFYNGLYQLISATGRQHPGILANTDQNGFKQSLFASLRVSDPNDAQKLETYRETYSYDISGNLVTLRHAALSVSWTRSLQIAASSNRTVTVQNGADTPSQTGYDACGNLTSLENLRSLVWNYRNNIASADVIVRDTGPSDSSYYTYDSSGHRVRKVVERKISDTVTEITEILYLGSLEIKRIKRSTAASETTVLERQTLHVMDEDRRIAIMNVWPSDLYQRETDRPAERRYRFQLNDHLGSACQEVDESANLISYEAYFPYGGTAIIAGEDQREVSLKTYRYCGKERDDCTGLYYYGARYYPPWLGRWLNPDPAGTVDGLNLYAFVGGNPVSFVDFGGKAKGKSQRQRKQEQKKAHVNFKKAREKFNSFSRGDKVTQKNMIVSARGGRSLRVTPNRVRAINKTLQKEMDRSKVKLDQFAAPPSTSAGVPGVVKSPAGAQGYSFTGNHLYVEKQQVVSKATLNVDGRDSTNTTMAQAMPSFSGNNLPANQYSGRDDSGKGGLGEAWCHLIAHCLGGAESADNMVAGSQGSNLVQLGIEKAIKSFIEKTGKMVLIKVGANVRVKTDGTITHIADSFHYQIFDLNNQAIYNTKFEGSILRADTIQKDKNNEVTKALYRHFGLKHKKVS